jgi:hypothetical protein
MDYQPVVLDLVGEADKLVTNAREAIDIVRRRGGHVGFRTPGLRSSTRSSTRMSGRSSG